MQARQAMIDRIKSYLPYGVEPQVTLQEEMPLADLGMTSMHLITMLLALQDEYGLSVDQVAEQGMPVTVGDLVALLERKADG
jgi:acyl carrier protein